MKRELLLGAGRNLTKKITVGGAAEWSNLTTLDFNRDHCPDIVADLDATALSTGPRTTATTRSTPTRCMEHLGRQGDWRFFFAQWGEFWRMLKPGGLFCGTSPATISPSGYGAIRVIPAPSRRRASCSCGSQNMQKSAKLR